MKEMKTQIIIAIATILATTCGATDNIAIPREPPIDAPHGRSINGLTLGLWSEADTYEVNTNMNVWITLSNTNKDAAGRTIPYDPTIHTNAILILSGPQTNTIRMYNTLPFDGPIGFGFQSGIGQEIHDHLRRPGMYTLQWKIGELESNVITLRIVAITGGRE